MPVHVETTNSHKILRHLVSLHVYTFERINNYLISVKRKDTEVRVFHRVFAGKHTANHARDFIHQQ
jgi:hypothetical protein